MIYYIPYIITYFTGLAKLPDFHFFFSEYLLYETHGYLFLLMSLFLVPRTSGLYWPILEWLQRFLASAGGRCRLPLRRWSGICTEGGTPAEVELSLGFCVKHVKTKCVAGSITI